MTNSIKIGNRLVGDGQPCFVIAEMSGNHGQDYERAKAIIRAAADAGADAVKMQAYTADTITLKHDGPDFQIPSDNSWSEFKTLHDLYQTAYTPWEWFEPLFEEARSLGMEAFCSVFDHSSVDYLESIGATVYKIAGPEITDVPLLQKVAQTGKPVILSSGLSTYDDLELASNTLRQSGCTDFVILKCTSEYPAPIEQANLRTIHDIRNSFGCLSGLSDHTTNTAVPVAAVCLGASVVEKHFTLDETKTVDSFFSLQPESFAQMVEQIRIAESAIGVVDYTLVGEDSGTAAGRRSLYACKTIRKGELFTKDNIRSVRPAYGLHPKYWDELIGSAAKRDIAFGDRLILDDLPTQQGKMDKAATTDSSSSASLESAIITLFVQAGAPQADSDKADYSLFDDESLDSFSRISIFMELEAEFGISLAPDEILKPCNRTVRGLAALIAERSQSALSKAS